MRLRPIADALGIILSLSSFTFLAPFGTALFYREGILHSLLVWGAPFGVLVLSGAALKGLGRGASERLLEREAYATVALAWLALAVVGALPFILSGAIRNPVDAYFESMSGFTSTGATVLVNIDGQIRSILLWRSLTQWLGGMGIVVLSVAVLSRFLGGGRAGLLLMKGEVPGTGVTRIKPKIQETASVLWRIYIAFTIAEIILLIVLGMTPFDAVNHALTTLPGGGFNTHDGNIEYYHWHVAAWRQIGIEVVLMLFMFLGATNFVLHYQVLKRNWRAPFREPEFRLFLYLIALATVLVTLDLTVNRVYPLHESARHGLFQVVSIVTTTGYNSVDFNLWPETSKYILFTLMFTGAMSGSTSGAIKIARFFFVLKAARSVVTRYQHAKAVTQVRVGQRIIESSAIRSAGLYIFLYVLVFVLASVVVAFTGEDLVTSSTAVAACIGTVGPGLGAVGPASNFLGLHWTAKLVLTTVMWMGRLEILACLLLFFPSSYRT